MKKYLSLKYLTTACFLVLLGTMFWNSIRPCYYMAYQLLQEVRAGQMPTTSYVEYLYNISLPGKTLYITLNSGFQRLMGARCVNERYRMDNGHLTYVVPETDVTPMAEKTVAFRDVLEEKGIPFAFVNTLFKIDPQDKQLPMSVEDFSNENTDRFLALLEEQGVTTLDLREAVKEQGLDHYSLFYVTDHHWTAETGFWAYTQLVSWLEEQDDSFAVDPRLMQAENYNHNVYEKIFCGSAARRIGPLYAGLDDLTVITPKFDTALTLSIPKEDLIRQGRYEDTLLFYDHLTTENLLEMSAYSVYLDADNAMLTISNHSRSQNLEIQSKPKKLLILKDSSVLVVAPYLALSYDEVCLIDLRIYNENLLEFIGEYQPDMVLTMYNPGALEAHNAMMYNFVK